jgi:hypothetical protein
MPAKNYNKNLFYLLGNNGLKSATFPKGQTAMARRTLFPWHVCLTLRRHDFRGVVTNPQ